MTTGGGRSGGGAHGAGDPGDGFAFLAASQGAPEAAAAQDPAVEEAAMLYANGHAQDAKAVLLKAIREDAPSGASARLWQMLLDLLQATGERREFDTRSLDFALKFQRSAPAWRGEERDPAAAMLRTGGGAYVSLSGKLSAESAAQLQKIQALAEKNRMLRIDFTKLQGIDGPGCRLLLELLQAIRRRGGDAMFTGDTVLFRALESATRAGVRDASPPLWLLRLEILQWQGRRREFEDVALDYAVTYEISPPSFEAPVPGAGGSVPSEREPDDGALRAPQVLSAQDAPFVARLEEAVRTRTRVPLDLSATDRVDFEMAGVLLNLAADLAERGKRLEIRHPNALVAALLEAIGATALATVVQRK